jgi:hypothetical protein
MAALLWACGKAELRAERAQGKELLTSWQPGGRQARDKTPFKVMPPETYLLLTSPTS